MKSFESLIISFLFFAMALFTHMKAHSKIKQFPKDDYTYTSNIDRNYSKYLTRSLYNTNKIALTFDDGPHIVNTPKLLDILKKHQVKATFFIMGEKITEETKPILERIINEGHHLASHHWSHDNSNSLSKEKYKKGLEDSINSIEQLTDDMGVHQNEMYYRFPYGAYGRNQDYHQLNVMKDISKNIYTDNCINFVFWDVDTVDWLKAMTAKDIATNIQAQLNGGTAFRHKLVLVNGIKTYVKESYVVTRPLKGGVVLMHDIHAKSVSATDIFLTQIKEKLLNKEVEILKLNEIKEFSYQAKECIRKN
jgi:peptidoglycan/xylan/chitin deacetylase (PgdA/CDA1 family)